MRTIKLAFVSSSIDYTQAILPFARRLEGKGHEVFWVSHRRAEYCWLLQQGVQANHILDIFSIPDTPVADLDLSNLARLEMETGIRINDIILMDRLVRKKSYDFGVQFAAHAHKSLVSFLVSNQIEFVSNGRDTLPQLIAWATCKQLGVSVITPSVTRILPESFFFCTSYDDSGWLPIQEPNNAHRSQAKGFLNKYNSSKTNRELHLYLLSDGTFTFMLAQLPKQLHYFIKLAGLAMKYDKGNDYTRYRISDLLRLAVRRKIEHIKIKSKWPFSQIGSKPFCVYMIHMQPESSIDVFGSYHSDQVNLIRNIARSIPVSHELYVKPHRDDLDGFPLTFYKSLKEIPAVRLIDPMVDSRELIRRAEIVFTVSGTAAFEAGLMQIPAITFAHNFFNSLPAVTYCESPKNLPRLISNIVMTPKVDRTEKVIEFLAGLFANSFPGQINGHYRPFSDQDLDRIDFAYHKAFEKIPF